ncbi:MAG TPA: pilin [Calditrichaeota bacterium]|nr:pilin [Calditrichota bacterium]
MKKQSGFTLIELMIVVAIIGILAAIALPAYKDYTIRAKISECVTALSSCKTSISEYYASEGSLPSDINNAGCQTTASQYCSSITIPAAGQASINATTATGLAADCSLLLDPVNEANGAIPEWAGSTTCDTKYVPANFRG